MSGGLLDSIRAPSAKVDEVKKFFKDIFLATEE